MSKGIKLAAGLTPDEERYAALLAEGGAQSVAFKAVWPPGEDIPPEDIYTRASLKASKVRQRVQDLVDQSTGQTIVNIETLTRAIDMDRGFAYDQGNAGAAIQATKLKAQLHRKLDNAPSTEGLLADIVRMLAGLDPAAHAKDITIEGKATTESDG